MPGSGILLSPNGKLPSIWKLLRAPLRDMCHTPHADSFKHRAIHPDPLPGETGYPVDPRRPGADPRRTPWEAMSGGKELPDRQSLTLWRGRGSRISGGRGYERLRADPPPFLLLRSCCRTDHGGHRFECGASVG